MISYYKKSQKYKIHKNHLTKNIIKNKNVQDN